MLANDLHDHATEMLMHPFLGWFMEPANLDQVRRDVLINMAFNIGVAGLAKWTNMLGSIKECDYEGAAKHGKDSRWFHQVGDGDGGYFDRAEELMEQLRTGLRRATR